MVLESSRINGPEIIYVFKKKKKKKSLGAKPILSLGDSPVELEIKQKTMIFTAS